MGDLNITDIVNQTINTPATTGIAEKAFGWVGGIAEFIKTQLATISINYSNFMSNILLLFISLVLIFLGTKIANKVVKILLIIVGAILVVGTIYSWIV